MIRDGLNICGTKVRLKKQKQEPIQCLKCRRWGHFVVECKVESDVCGICAEVHQTNACGNKGKLHCVSCADNLHPSQDRNCPEFIRRCAIYDKCNPENAMLYYPSDQDWSMTVRPERIPIDERFLQKYAVNSILSIGNKHLGAAPYPLWKKPKQKMQRRPPQNGTTEKTSQENPNLILISQGREVGKIMTKEKAWREEPMGFASVMENTDKSAPFAMTGWE